MNSPNSKDAVNFSLQNLTRQTAPRLPYQKIKEAILGKAYELSLVFVGAKRSQTLNRIYRGKDKPANVLSFPLSKKSGEIFIDLTRAKEFGVGYLFIHGLLHLKGMEHGSRMERNEKKFLKLFNIIHYSWRDTSQRA